MRTLKADELAALSDADFLEYCKWASNRDVEHEWDQRFESARQINRERQSKWEKDHHRAQFRIMADSEFAQYGPILGLSTSIDLASENRLRFNLGDGSSQILRRNYG